MFAANREIETRRSTMTDRNRVRRSRRIAGAIRPAALGAALAAVLASAACTQVKENVSNASAQIDQWLGTGSDQAAATGTAAEPAPETAPGTAAETDAARLYQEGLDAHARKGVLRELSRGRGIGPRRGGL
jgi:hypothetical protein